MGFTPYNATNPSAYISLTALSATSPIFYNNTTGVISSQAATTSLNGYLTSTNWNTFNNKQSAITLTTTGSSGASTFVTNTLNIPSYTLAGLGGISLTALSATTPLNYNNTTGVFTINQSTTSTSGYLSNTDWNTFNGKQDLLNGTGFLKATGSSISYDNSTYLTSTGSAASLTSFPTLNQSTTGNAGTATILQTARTINGVSFNGSSNINIVVPIVVTTATSNYNVSTTDDYILGDATSASITITLPTAIGVTKPFTIKRINSGVNVVNINTTSSQTMDGSTSIAMNIQNQSLSFVSNNANWFIK